MTYLVKKHMMAIVAVVLVIGFSAFKIVEKKKTISIDPSFETWYFIGTLPTEVTQADKYTLLNPELCGDETDAVCEILAPILGNQPDLGHVLNPGNPTPITIADRINDAMGPGKNPNEIVQSFREL